MEYDDRVKLYECCREGNIEKLKEIYNKRNKTFYESHGFSYQHENLVDYDHGLTIFMLFCASGHLELAKWLHSCKIEDLKITGTKRKLKAEYRDDELKKRNSKGMNAFLLACKYGKEDVAKWLYSIDPEQINDVDYEGNTPFVLACANLNIEFVKWIHSIAPEQIGIINKKKESPFIKACVSNNLPVVKWIYSIIPEEINKLDYEKKSPLVKSFQNNNVELSQWIYSVAPEQLNIGYEERHCISDSECGTHHIKQTLGIPTYFDPNFSEEYFIIHKMPVDTAIDYSCTQILKWLYTIIPEQINENSEDIFRIAILRDNLDTAQWIYSKNHNLSKCKYKQNIYSFEDKVPSNTVSMIDYALDGQIKVSNDMLVWLCSIDEEYESSFVELINLNKIQLLKSNKKLQDKLKQHKIQ